MLDVESPCCCFCCCQLALASSYFLFSAILSDSHAPACHDVFCLFFLVLSWVWVFGLGLEVLAGLGRCWQVLTGLCFLLTLFFGLGPAGQFDAVNLERGDVGCRSPRELPK